ncbi:MAG: arsenic transporter [Solobacterium sp.]|jgi:Na+/H+ antiporter NhaD/arsenite permease-like protein|nr:arsenic transporter [Solobacterium sp.]MCH4205480.1 arsenic transporter [Solobacterium sp.]MCH4227004.1 arsenic transporter [Solobacterium sp.]MCH4282167.1 arsenic transporter [Solobacterium sp.]
MIPALIIFIIMYALLLALPDKRYITALAAAAVFIVTGILPIQKVIGAVEWNVILMLAGTMMVVELFIESRMPARMAEQLLKIVPNIQWAIVALALFAGLVSAFVDNVATVLMVAPIGLAVAKKLHTNPIPVIISIAVSSNLQGAATLVGDTTSILLGGYANMSFNDFFWFMGRPGIAFSVEAGALLTIPVLLFLFRKEKDKVDADAETKVDDKVPTFLMFGVIAALIFASQFPNKPELTNGFICIGFAAFGILYRVIREKSTDVIARIFKAVDYHTLLLLIGLFIVIGGISEAGVISAIADLFVKIGGNSLFLMYTLIVFASVFISAFVDNIPYVATMLPVVQGIAVSMGVEPYVLYYGLLIGATLGGNLTPVGASANIAGIGILQKDGYEVSTTDYLKIGVPFTLVAVAAGYIVNWLIWGM